MPLQYTLRLRDLYYVGGKDGVSRDKDRAKRFDTQKEALAQARLEGWANAEIEPIEILA